MSLSFDYFRRKLQQAEPIENEAIRLICERNNVSLTKKQDVTNYKEMHYDFQTSDGLTYEVKADFLADRTGNVFVEFVQFGKPSGIQITEAMFHIYYFNDTYHLIDTEDLLLLCDASNNIKYVPMTHSKGYCIEISEFIKCCDILKVGDTSDEIDVHDINDLN